MCACTHHVYCMCLSVWDVWRWCQLTDLVTMTTHKSPSYMKNSWYELHALIRLSSLGHLNYTWSEPISHAFLCRTPIIPYTLSFESFILMPVFLYHLLYQIYWFSNMLTTRKGAVLPFRQDEVHDDNDNGNTATNTNHYRYQRRGTSRQSTSKWTSITSGTISSLTHPHCSHIYPLIT